MAILGSHYSSGIGVDKDPSEAIRWYQRAAEKGYALAMHQLGRCYENGYDVPQNLATAVFWYRNAAAAGDSVSLGRLKALGFDPSPAACFEKGKRHYDTKEYAEAVEFFRIAAHQGHTDAQHCLGNCYYTGKGVDKDPAEAVKWYRKAAEQGHPAAQNALGFCYAHGAGVEQSHSTAFMWYKKAADAGHAGAINSVAWHYAYGGAAGVKRNKEEAIRLFLINANKGDQYAIRQLRELGYKI
jgi:TPR repeat protein